MKKRIVWLLTNASVLVLLYFALFKEMEWAENAFKFILWVTTIFYFLVNMIDDLKKELSKKEMSVPAGWSIWLDFGISVLLASFGWFFYAALNIVQGILCVAMYGKSDKEK